MKTFHLIAAARPNFMKIAPLYHALRGETWCEPKIVHTGQHYDPNMSDAFFRDLRMPSPDIHLGVGSGTHAEQTGGVMIAYEKICLDNPPDLIIVVGDVNSTAACAIVGAKLHIPVAHLEAGLRSRDRRMPEEINRLITDAISDILWTPSPDADANLLQEGIASDKIERIGNIMIDSYEMLREQIDQATARKDLGLSDERYVVVTLHRPSNVDRRETLSRLVDQLIQIAQDVRLVFSVHPRTRRRLTEFGLLAKLESAAGVKLTEPMGYIDFMNLVKGSSAVITDSGGVQEETTYLAIPCLTLRENTERPITITEGTNRLVRPEDLVGSIGLALSGAWGERRVPERWDGHAAERAVEFLRTRFL